MNNQKPSRLAFLLSLIFVMVFCSFRITTFLAREDDQSALGILILGVGCILMLFVFRRIRRIVDMAFSIPLFLYLALVGGAFFVDSFLFFFPICIAICGLGALYFNHKKLLRYIIISNIISVGLLVFILPQLYAGKEIIFTEVVLAWFISLFSSIFIYIVVAFASDKNNAAIKAQDSFTALLASTPNRIVLVDSLNRVTYFSKPFERMAHLLNPEAAIGRPIFDLFKESGVKQIIHEILKNSVPYEGTREITLDGKQHYFEIITGKLVNETKGRLINLIDITPVMEAKIEAEEASRSKSAFLATMSHEIRTPLNAIIGLSEIELQKKLPDETHRDLEKIHNSGASLLAIINDILDISKIEAGNFELIPVDYDLPSMVNDTIHLNIMRIGSKHIVFKLEIDDTIPVKLFGDELRVKQILNNLLSNAFKYTSEGTVTLKIRWELRDKNAWLTFSVRDTGRGIRKEDLSRIFSEYSQLDARANRHIEGTGLGLSITKNLVALMKGIVNVESEYGRGSVFTVQIPQKIVDISPIGELTARNLAFFRFKEKKRGRGVNLIRNYMPYGKVLVVDDVETNLDVARGLMLPYGLAIDCAFSGAEAIRKIRAAGEDPDAPRYDLVLMDHMMPEMDGVEAVRIIRNEIGGEYARTVPIIALTANALAGNEEMFLSRGFSAYISKPIDIMQLDVALNTWVRNKQSKETLLQAEMEKAARSAETGRTEPSVLEDLYVEGIDLALGRERYNNETAYLEILRSYHLHTPAVLEKLRNLSPEGRIPLADYTVMIHGLKGSSYGIYANTIGKRAEELETAARDGDLERVLAANSPFIETVELLLLDLGELLRKASENRGKKPKAGAPDPTLLTKLLDASKRFKSTTMEEILAELEFNEYESGGDLILWLREQMDNLEYDAIRKRLETPAAAQL